MVSTPPVKNRPTTPSTVVADMKSPAMARPFWPPVTLPSAAYMASRLELLRDAQAVIARVRPTVTKKQMMPIEIIGRPPGRRRWRGARRRWKAPR